MFSRKPTLYISPFRDTFSSSPRLHAQAHPPTTQSSQARQILTEAECAGRHNLGYLSVVQDGSSAVLLPAVSSFNPLNPELNPICYLLALLAHNFLHISRIRVKSLTIRLLMSYIYIYGAPILDVSRSHTTTHHSR